MGTRGVVARKQSMARASGPLWAAMAVALLGSCGGGSGGAAKACTPGLSTACTCTNGSTGAQTCKADGSGYGACSCTGGSGGVSGGTGGASSGTGGAPVGSGGANVGSGGTPAGTGGAGAGPAGTGGVGTGGARTGGAPGTGGAAGSGIMFDGGIPDGAVTAPEAGTGPDGGGGYTGRLVTVLIEDALIGPGKVDHTPWDEGNPIPPEVFSSLTTALSSASPFTNALAVVGGRVLSDALSAAQKPDIYGTIRLDVFGQVGTEYWLATFDQRMADSFTPAFPAPSGFLDVPIDADVRIRIHLADADLVNDDEVGIAVINSEDMQAALASRMKYQVPVWDQTNNQILFIGISVQ